MENDVNNNKLPSDGGMAGLIKKPIMDDRVPWRKLLFLIGTGAVVVVGKVLFGVVEQSDVLLVIVIQTYLFIHRDVVHPDTMGLTRQCNGAGSA